MPNNYFQFKQFKVYQEHCAMKVCTDACLFGSLLPTSSGGGGAIKHVLDIGTGTGLLSLMYAQKNTNAIIDAVEIDEAAAMQAAQNFEASLWKERLHVHNNSIQKFSSSAKQTYDLVISNPPFFENDLKSNDSKRNLALHSSDLNLEELLNAVTIHLKEDGLFTVLLPFHRTESFENFAATKYFLKEKVLVKQTQKHDYFRSMLLFSKQQHASVNKEIIIKDATNQYTPEFAILLKDYYLHL